MNNNKDIIKLTQEYWLSNFYENITEKEAQAIIDSYREYSRVLLEIYSGNKEEIEK